MDSSSLGADIRMIYWLLHHPIRQWNLNIFLKIIRGNASLELENVRRSTSQYYKLESQWNAPAVQISSVRWWHVIARCRHRSIARPLAVPCVVREMECSAEEGDVARVSSGHLRRWRFDRVRCRSAWAPTCPDDQRLELELFTLTFSFPLQSQSL